jgi:hypothetical protein
MLGRAGIHAQRLARRMITRYINALWHVVGFRHAEIAGPSNSAVMKVMWPDNRNRIGVAKQISGLSVRGTSRRAVY